MSVTVGSLFSGIGGLDLGLERAGMNVIWQSEIDPYACRVLAKHWPTIPNHGDIKTIDWKQIERPNIICGGYPCQPFSQAGKRAGTDDPRHLWPWVREAISHLRPDFAILENVRGHLSLGLPTVLGEMSEIGYDAEWQIVSAAGVGAPHRRDRVFIVAYPNGSNPTDGRQRENVPSQDQSGRDDRRGGRSDIGEECVGGTRQAGRDMANAHNSGSGTPKRGVNANGPTFIKERQDKSFFGVSRQSADVAYSNGNGTQVQASGFFSGIKELERYTWWETEPDVGRVAHGVSSRVDRLKCLGNAVVPQVSEFVGRIVMECYQ